MDKTGKMIIIGGREDKDGRRQILARVAEEAGGRDGSLLIITTATHSPQETGAVYRRIFSDLGIDRVEVLNIDGREYADSHDVQEKIRSATGIFFTGGDQLRITSILGGSRAGTSMKSALKRGTLLAGTSAGASVMSETMIIGGIEEGPPGKGTVQLAPGLGFLEGVVIDQHFAQRGRIGRLISAVAQNPKIIGIGIDEDTAIIMGGQKSFKVLGKSTVTIVDGRNITYSNISELEADQPLTLAGVTLHSLSDDYGYDLNLRQVIYKEGNQ
ncbi:MAG: cyanophycinase [Halanaerobium sp.]|nr:cyanophycinase [Halanaerobium sp.]